MLSVKGSGKKANGAPRSFSEYECGFSKKRPKNKAEAEFYDRATAAGWTATKRGWPDFFCINEAGEICVVEVKPTAGSGLKMNQINIMKQLAKAGIKAYKWTPEDGFTEVKPD